MLDYLSHDADDNSLNARERLEEDLLLTSLMKALVAEVYLEGTDSHNSSTNVQKRAGDDECSFTSVIPVRPWCIYSSQTL